jgi:uncharacterized protein YjbI with pentapeptide repeats
MAGNDRRKQMANQEYLDLLKRDTDAWNKWREQHPEIRPDLSGTHLSVANLNRAILSGANLSGANLREADLSYATLIDTDLSGADLYEAVLYEAVLYEANLSYANLSYANLSYADLSYADLSGANLSTADLSEAYLSTANLSYANLSYANLSTADLSGADLSGATIVRTNFTKAILTNCRIYGISAWDVELTRATQNNLIITDYNQPTITVDNLKIAQFIYLLLNNQEIRDVINTINTKVILILGRFTPERKTVLNALRNILHTKDYVPIIFDFDKPASKDTHETITTLARLARFIIADITEAKSIPQELVSIVESLPSLAIQPLLQRGSEPWGMYDHIKRYPWVLPIHRYIDLPDLLATLEERVIDPAEQKAQGLIRPS